MAHSNECSTPALRMSARENTSNSRCASMDTADAKAEVERIAREVLTNPVIEEYTYRLEE